MPIHRLATLALVAVVAAGCGSAREVKDPRGAEQNAYGCDRCHGYPPQPGWLSQASAHPKNDANCSYCHPQTVKSDQHTLIPASQGGLHENGQVDYVHGHEPGYGAPARHVPDALNGLAHKVDAQDCYVCHGSDLRGGVVGTSCVACHIAPHGDPRFPSGVVDFRTNCTFCHGQAKAAFSYDTDLNLAAPPIAIYPHADDDPAIGAHQAHLGSALLSSGGVAGVACASCHTVPIGTFPGSLDHLDGSAEPVFAGVANARGTVSSYDAANQTCATYCHGAAWRGGTTPAPKWTDGAQACDSCHGNPPTTGGGDVGWHAFHVNAQSLDCGKCHPGFVKGLSVNPALHINGTPDVSVEGTSGTVVIPVNDPPSTNWSDLQCQTCHTALGLPIPPGHG